MLLYSVGKDSSCLLRLAQKAFHPGEGAVPADARRHRLQVRGDVRVSRPHAREIGADLLVWRNEAAIAAGANPFDLGTQRCCGLLKTEALLTGLRHHRFDAAIGGARRDEEKSRAKERFFSFRDAFGQWDPKNQRPELWNLYNARVNARESIRVFPLSNWTELDVWRYIYLEQIPVNPLYFAEPRDVVRRGGQLIVLDALRGRRALRAAPGEAIEHVLCPVPQPGLRSMLGRGPSPAARWTRSSRR